jgi:hypothetical protein
MAGRETRSVGGTLPFTGNDHSRYLTTVFRSPTTQMPLQLALSASQVIQRHGACFGDINTLGKLWDSREFSDARPSQ